MRIGRDYAYRVQRRDPTGAPSGPAALDPHGEDHAAAEVSSLLNLVLELIVWPTQSSKRPRIAARPSKTPNLARMSKTASGAKRLISASMSRAFEFVDQPLSKLLQVGRRGLLRHRAGSIP